MKHIVDETINLRLDAYLTKIDIPEIFSRTYIDDLIKKEKITVNGKAVKKSLLIKPGDLIEIEIPKKEERKLIPENIPLNIVFEDEFLAVVDKPAGLTVHPAPGNFKGTLVNALVHHFKNDLSGSVNDNRPGIVHRLDKDTTGLIMVAKQDKTHFLLAEMFRKRSIEKFYKAVVVGVPAQESGTIKTFIKRSNIDRKKMAVSKTGKEAITHYNVIGSFDFFSLLEIRLETGRTHQIRVHLSNLNLPVLGDNIYSSLKRTLNGIPTHLQKKVKYLLANHLHRQALHAYKLRFEHPVTQQNIEITSELPADMKYTMSWLEKNFSGESD